MRINLTTPFAEKDQAKALGARWDGTRKVWYISDVADLTPFLRWIPDLAAASQTQAKASSRSSPQTSPSRIAAAAITTRPQQKLGGCDCAVLPWEPCAHTKPEAPQLSSMGGA